MRFMSLIIKESTYCWLLGSVFLNQTQNFDYLFLGFDTISYGFCSYYCYIGSHQLVSEFGLKKLRIYHFLFYLNLLFPFPFILLVLNLSKSLIHKCSKNFSKVVFMLIQYPNKFLFLLLVSQLNFQPKKSKFLKKIIIIIYFRKLTATYNFIFLSQKKRVQFKNRTILSNFVQPKIQKSLS